MVNTDGKPTIFFFSENSITYIWGLLSVSERELNLPV